MSVQKSLTDCRDRLKKCRDAKCRGESYRTRSGELGFRDREVSLQGFTKTDMRRECNLIQAEINDFLAKVGYGDFGSLIRDVEELRAVAKTKDLGGVKKLIEDMNANADESKAVFAEQVETCYAIEAKLKEQITLLQTKIAEQDRDIAVLLGSQEEQRGAVEQKNKKIKELESKVHVSLMHEEHTKQLLEAAEKENRTLHETLTHITKKDVAQTDLKHDLEREQKMHEERIANLKNLKTQYELLKNEELLSRAAMLKATAQVDELKEQMATMEVQQSGLEPLLDNLKRYQDNGNIEHKGLPKFTGETLEEALRWIDELWTSYKYVSVRYEQCQKKRQGATALLVPAKVSQRTRTTRTAGGARDRAASVGASSGDPRNSGVRSSSGEVAARRILQKSRSVRSMDDDTAPIQLTDS